MSTFLRWCRFNLVGATGMAVQLSSLTLLNKILHGRYLIGSTIAVELAVINNFAWHSRYTWSDRREGTHWPAQLFRFHLANGAVSLLGNLILMRLFVHELHSHVLFANTCTIACCSLINFALSDNWAFRRTSATA